MTASLLRTAAIIALVAPAGVGAQQITPDDDVPPALCSALGDHFATPLASPIDELRRIAEISGCAEARSRLLRRAGFDERGAAPAGAFALRALPVSLLAVDRTAYPDDRNNGALWEGVGISTSLRPGLELSLPYLTVSLRPEILYQQNRRFEMRDVERVGYSEYANPFYTDIDLPNRFGPDSWWDLAAGDSYARVDVGWFGAGLSTESLWRGPAVRYPIIMSNTAGGFPHVFLGAARGVDVYVGDLQAELVWGRLSESDYFDGKPANDESRIINVAMALDLRWPEGLSLGGTRSYLYLSEDDDSDAMLGTVGLAHTENRPGNELASLFGRWVFENSGAEVYFEWAREDVIGEWVEFIHEPDHAQAFLFGLQKLTELDDDLALRVHAELVHLQEKGEARTDSRGTAVFYTHYIVTQGYTHRGQLLGAGVGPGADAQFLAVDALFGTSMVGGYLERVRRNDWTVPALDLRRWAPYEHDTEIVGGLRGLHVRGPVSVSLDLARTIRWNRDFEPGKENAWRTELRLGWTPDFRWTR